MTKRYVIVHRGLIDDVFYGPFDTQAKAIAWAFNRFGQACGVTTWNWQPRTLESPDA